jgi:hypothetical protein
MKNLVDMRVTPDASTALSNGTLCQGGVSSNVYILKFNIAFFINI